MSQPNEETVKPTRSWWFGPASIVPTYLGVLAIAVGFGLIGVAWADVAGVTVVSLQMPYLVSAGFTGLGLVTVGVMLVSTAVRRQDGARRDRQLETLTETLLSTRDEVERLSREMGRPS